MVRGWPPPAMALPPGSAQARLRQLTDYCTQYPQFPDSDVAEGYRRYTEAVARLATPGCESPVAQLRRLLSNPLVVQVWRVKTRTRMAYYTLTEPVTTDAGCQFQGLISLDGREKPVFVREANLSTAGLSPQSRLAKRLKPVLARAAESPAAWDAALLDALRTTQQEPELDPVLRAGLLKGLVEAASRGSTLLGDALKGHAQALDNAQFDPDVAWVNPEDWAAEAERNWAEAVLKSLPPFEPLVTQVGQARQRLEAEVTRYYWPVGLLLKDPDGTWRCRTLARDLPDADLFILVPTRRWQKVGKGAGGAEGRW